MTLQSIFKKYVSTLLEFGMPFIFDKIKKREKIEKFIGIKNFETLFYKLVKKAERDLKKYFPKIDFSINEKKLKDSFKYNLNYEANNKGPIDLYDKTLISNFADILIKNGAVTVTDKQSSEEDIKQKVRNLLRTAIIYFNAELFTDFPELYIFKDEQIIKSILKEMKETIAELRLKFLDKTIQIIFSKTNNLSRFKLTLSENLKYYIERKYTEEIISRVNDLESGIILLHGEPGSGKTAIMANLVKEMGFPPHFFFGKGQGKEIENAKSDISNMAIDYLGLEIIDTVPINRYDKLLELQNDYDKRLIIIIDGIDEAEGSIEKLFPDYEKGNKNIIYIVSAKTNSVSCNRVKSQIDSKYTIELKTKNDESETKTKEYLEKRFKEDEALVKIVNDRDFQEKQNIENLKNKIIKRAAGNFTYVRFILDSISHGIELPAKFPKELYKIYEIIYNKLDDEINCEYFEQILSLYSIFSFQISKDSIKNFLENGNFNQYKFNNIFNRIKWLFKKSIENGESKYIFFHNSFKEFIKKRNEKNIDEAYELIIKYCKNKIDSKTEKCNYYKYIPKIVYKYAKELNDNGKTNKAIKYFKFSKKIGKKINEKETIILENDALCQSSIGNILIKKGKYKQAEDIIKNANRIYKKIINMKKKKIDIYFEKNICINKVKLADISLKKGEINKATKLLKEVNNSYDMILNFSEKHFFILKNKGVCLSKLAYLFLLREKDNLKYLRLSIKSFISSRTLGENDIFFYNNYGITLINLGDYYSNLGKEKIAEKLYIGAIKFFEKSLSQRKDFFRAYKNIGKCLSKQVELYFKFNKKDFSQIQTKYDNAIKNFNKSLKFFDEYTDSYLHKGICNMNMYKINLQLNINDKDYFKLAISDFKNAKRLNSNDSEIFYNISSLYWIKAENTVNEKRKKTCIKNALNNINKANELTKNNILIYKKFKKKIISNIITNN